MRDYRRILENTSVLLVLLLSAPLAAMLIAVLLTYLVVLFMPDGLGKVGEMRDLFAMMYAVIYLTICFFAVKGT